MYTEGFASIAENVCSEQSVDGIIISLRSFNDKDTTAGEERESAAALKELRTEPLHVYFGLFRNSFSFGSVRGKGERKRKLKLYESPGRKNIAKNGRQAISMQVTGASERRAGKRKWESLYYEQWIMCFWLSSRRSVPGSMYFDFVGHCFVFLQWLIILAKQNFL